MVLQWTHVSSHSMHNDSYQPLISPSCHNPNTPCLTLLLVYGLAILHLTQVIEPLPRLSVPRSFTSSILQISSFTHHARTSLWSISPTRSLWSKLWESSSSPGKSSPRGMVGRANAPHVRAVGTLSLLNALAVILSEGELSRIYYKSTPDNPEFVILVAGNYQRGCRY